MAKKEMRRMEIEPAENGGHTVTHHYREAVGKGGMSGSYQEPEQHVFGANEGHEMLAHVANHLEIPEMEDDEEDEPEKLSHEKASKIREKANAR
jgi:hypothetical protein